MTKLFLRGLQGTAIEEMDMTGRMLCAAWLWVAVALLTTGAAGCNTREPGKSYEDLKKVEGDAVSALKARGAKMTEMNYPQGKAWAIDLSGKQISDDVFEEIKKAGYTS